jgi:hypothetical protein
MGKAGKSKTITVQPGAYGPVAVFFALSLLAIGLFYEVLSCVAGLALVAYLVYVGHKNGGLALPRGYTLPAVALVTAFYGVSALWAVDKGMALVGFVKFLPLPLFCLASAQWDKAWRRSLLELVPWLGAGMTVASYLLGQITAWADYFFLDGRLSGFFQYPNTFGLFLLLGVVILAERGSWTVKRGLCLGVLLVGIFLSGSRTVFALLVVTVVLYGLWGTSRLGKWFPLGLVGLLLLATVLYGALGGDSAAGRYLTNWLSSSTFLGRLLYFRDALPVILRHPFGLGYLGYWFTQGSFQTGVYSVMNVHNELLQLLLDVGWVPTAGLVFALVQAVRPGRNSRLGRMILALLGAHCLFDFDLQFVAMGFVGVLAMELEAEPGHTVTWNGGAWVLSGLVGCLCLYMGLATGLYYAQAYRAAGAVYPGYTTAWLKLLPQAEDADSMDEIADRILRRNRSCALAYSAKARAAYAAGDFGAVISYKEQAIALTKYSQAEYLDYFDMLLVGVQLYTANGDTASADYCRQRLLDIPQAMEQVLDDTSALGWRIVDQPDLTLPESYQQAVAQLEAMG